MFPQLELVLRRSVGRPRATRTRFPSSQGSPAFARCSTWCGSEALAKPGKHMGLSSLLSPDAPQRGWAALGQDLLSCSCRNLHAFSEDLNAELQLLREEVAQARAEISHMKVILHFRGGGLAGQNPHKSPPWGSWWGRTADCKNPAFAPGACWVSCCAAQALLRLQAAEDSRQPSLGTPAPLAPLAGGWRDPGTLTGPAIACGPERVSRLTRGAWRVGTRVWGPSPTHLGAMAVDTATVPQSSRLTSAAESLAALWTRLAWRF